MTNLFQRFQRLIPKAPLQVGEVTALNSDGTSTVVLPSGGSVRAMGQLVSIGSNAFVQDGRVIGSAPDLPTTEIDV